MKQILETKRLYLREITKDDVSNLLGYFSNPEVMKFSKVRDKKETQEWIDWTLKSYESHGFGKWAVCLKNTNEVIGDCGITYQTTQDLTLPELGYRLSKTYWHKGYAIEAAAACKEYAFSHLGMTVIYSIISKHNQASISVAQRNGMQLWKELVNPTNGFDVGIWKASQLVTG
jgi:ribosomal-protein-alanine N-acetyltransferase